MLLICNLYFLDSNNVIFNVLTLEQFHKNLLKKLELDEKGVILKLEEVRNAILECPKNVNIFLCRI